MAAYDTSNSFNLSIAAAPTTVLETAAAGMSSGDWLQLTGGNLPAGLDLFTDVGGLFSGGSDGMAIAYCEKFARDETGKQFHFVGSDHFGAPNPAGAHGVYLRYDEADNEWTFVSNAPSGVSPGTNNTPHHGYSGSTFDPDTGFWHHPPYGTVIYQRETSSWDSNSMSAAFAVTTATGCAEYFPERDRIMVCQVENGTDATLAEVNPSAETTSVLVSHSTGTITGFGAYSCAMNYSKVRARVFFGGGNGSNRIWSVNSSGTVTRHDDCPVNFGPSGPSSSFMMINPSNGNPVVVSNSSTWRELNIDAGSGSQWSSKGGTVSILSSNTVNSTAYGVMASTTDYGVVALVKNYSRSNDAQMWLWKP